MSIAVITFYTAQVSCIENELKRVSGINRPIPVLTVDSFQGSEADIIIVSFVRSNLGNRVGFLQDFRRLNVALTRAKHLLVLFGSSRVLTDCGVENLTNIVYDAKKRGRFFDFEVQENSSNEGERIYASAGVALQTIPGLLDIYRESSENITRHARHHALAEGSLRK